MRLALLLLLAAPVAAQPAAPASPQPDRWRIEASVAVAGADDPGVRIERRAWGPLWAGLGRTELGSAVAYVAAEHAVGPLAPRATAGLTTAGGSLTPAVGVGLDVFPVQAVGLGLAVEQEVGERRVVRVGLRVRPDLVDPEGARPLFSDGTAAPHWRAALGFGLANEAETAVPSLSLERTVSGPFSAGARVAAYTSGFVDDGGPHGGGAVEAFAAAGPAGRYADLRALAGVGLSVSERSVALDEPFTYRTERAVRPLLTGGLGLDVYPFAGVGVGVEGRLALAAGGPGLSEVGVGLRVRLR